MLYLPFNSIFYILEGALPRNPLDSTCTLASLGKGVGGWLKILETFLIHMIFIAFEIQAVVEAPH